MEPYVWVTQPTITVHDCAAYLLAREIPIDLDARGEIVQALVAHVCDRLARLVCPWRRHIMQTIRLRHALGAGRILPRPQSVVEILNKLLEDPAATDILRQICDPDGEYDSLRLMILCAGTWVGFSLEDLYCRRGERFTCDPWFGRVPAWARNRFIMKD